MKKLSAVSFLIVLVLLLNLFTPVFTVYAETSYDTSYDPWYGYTPIHTAQELAAVKDNLSGKYYLADDITFSDADFAEGGDFYNGGAGWLPIGTEAAPFTGVFDGCNHSITGLKMTPKIDQSETGLFGTNSGVIKRIKLTGSITAACDEGFTFQYISLLVALNNKDAFIGDCSTAGYINIDAKVKRNLYIGAISSNNLGTIQRCFNAAKIDTTGSNCYTGSIAGLNNGDITDCYNTGDITSAGLYTFGIASGKTIYNCYNTALISINGAPGYPIAYYDSPTSSYYLYNSLYVDENSHGATAVTQDELALESTFVGWDFTHVWALENGIMPLLRENDIDLGGGTAFTAGNGTEENPFTITEKKQLKNIYFNKHSYFILETDIYFTEDDYNPGGEFYMPSENYSEAPCFYANFDGNEHIISGLKLKIYNDTGTYAKKARKASLLKANYGVIRNVNFQNIQYDFHDLVDIDIGIISYDNHGTISNCSIKDNIDLESSSEATLSLIEYGGFAQNNYGLIEYCKAGVDVNITANAVYIGAIAAMNYSTIKGCYNTGTLISSAVSTNIGGIVNENCKSGVIEQCYNTGYIYTNMMEVRNFFFNRIGGIAATNQYVEPMYGISPIISNCFNTGTIYTIVNKVTDYSGTERMVCIGGVVGINDHVSTTTNCYNTGFIHTINLNDEFDINCGGLAGYNWANISGVSLDYGLPATSGGRNLENISVKSASEMKTRDAYPGFDFDTVWKFLPEGDYLLPVFINGKFEFTKSVAGAYITKAPDKLNYSDKIFDSGELDTTGIEVSILYNNTDTESTDNYEISYNYLSYGTNFIYIIYEIDSLVYIDYFEIEITPDTISSVTLASPPDKTDYFLGIDTEFTLAGASLLVKYADGSERTLPLTFDFITEETSVIFSGAAVGRAVEIDFYGHKASFTLNIFNPYIDSDRFQLYTTSGEYSYIMRITPGTSARMLLDSIKQKGYVKIYKNGQEVSPDLMVPTGSVIKLVYNDTEIHTAGVFVSGDLNGDGAVTISDLVIVKSYLLGNDDLSGLSLPAADTNRDGNISITDFVVIKSHLLGNSNID